MNDQSNHVSEIEETTEGAREPDVSTSTESRRRLIKGGLSAAPVILTLASRPVLAWHCKPPSAHASANTSKHVHQEWRDECTLTAVQWKNLANGRDSGGFGCRHLSSWPQSAGFPATSLRYSELLGWADNRSLKEVLNSTGYEFEKVMIAAMLNFKRGMVPPGCLTENDIKDMATPPYTVSTGEIWNQPEIIKYLKENWIATLSSWY